MKPIHQIHQMTAALGGLLRQFEEIPLKNEGSDCCYPSYASSGPSLYISGRKDSKVYDMPKEGTAKIKFRMRSKGVDYRDNGEETFRTDIEVQSIEPVDLEAIVGSYDFAHPIGKRMKFMIEDGLGSFGQSKASSEIKSVSGRALRKAGAPKDAMRAAVKMRKTFVGRGDKSLSGVASSKWPGKQIEIEGKSIRGGNGVEIIYESQMPSGRLDLEAILARYAGETPALHDFGDRARDTGGRFAPGTDVSADDMAAAYVKPKRKKEAALLAGASVAGVTAAVAGKRAMPAISQGVGRLVRGAMS